jgi:hypothetical protein
MDTCGEIRDATAVTRSYFDTETSISMRGVNSRTLVGKVVQIHGDTGTVKAIVPKLGSSTFHTIEFDNGGIETIQLAKHMNGKGTKFHVSE